LIKIYIISLSLNDDRAEGKMASKDEVSMSNPSPRSLLMLNAAILQLYVGTVLWPWYKGQQWFWLRAEQPEGRWQIL